MSSILEKYKTAVNSFQSQNDFDAWLVTFGNALSTSNTSELRVRTNYIKGCKNNCWIDKVDDNIVFDSDAIKTKGLGKILTDVYNMTDNTAGINFIDFKDITRGLSRDELIGFSKMLNRIHNLTNNS